MAAMAVVSSPMGLVVQGTSKKIPSLAMNRIGGERRQRLIAATRFPGVRRWEAWTGGLREPSILPKAIRTVRATKPSPNFLVCSLAPTASSVQIASTMFTSGTAFVVPVYTAMILAPKWKWTKKIAESDLPFIVMSTMYMVLLAMSWTPQTAGLLFASKYYLPELPGITGMFSSSVTVASAWLHLLGVDLFCGRTVYLDGLQNKVETRHSLVLCLLMCPVGLISHCITKWKRSPSPREHLEELVTVPPTVTNSSNSFWRGRTPLPLAFMVFSRRS